MQDIESWCQQAQKMASKTLVGRAMTNFSMKRISSVCVTVVSAGLHEAVHNQPYLMQDSHLRFDPRQMIIHFCSTPASVKELQVN